MARKKKVNIKKYCKRGHDTFITGRDTNRECTECRRARKKGILDTIVISDEILQKIKNIPTKFCPRCNQIKNKTEFNPDKSRADGLSGYCRTCVNVLTLEWKHKNRVYHNSQGRKWHKEHKEQSKANSLKWRTENPEKKKSSVRN